MVMFTIAAVIICGAIVLWYILTFNSLVNARNAVDQAWSHIEVELKRRLDLIQNLVEIAK
jgi:LemA protein